MSEHSPIHAPIPGLGLRSLKTAIAATLTCLLYTSDAADDMQV